MIKAFDNYRALPAGGSLSRIAEVGSGPWTQTNSLLLFRPDLSASSIALIDPGIKGYLHAPCIFPQRHIAWRSGRVIADWR